MAHARTLVGPEEGTPRPSSLPAVPRPCSERPGRPGPQGCRGAAGRQVGHAASEGSAQRAAGPPAARQSGGGGGVTSRPLSVCLIPSEKLPAVPDVRGAAAVPTWDHLGKEDTKPSGEPGPVQTTRLLRPASKWNVPKGPVLRWHRLFCSVRTADTSLDLLANHC